MLDLLSGAKISAELCCEHRIASQCLPLGRPSSWNSRLQWSPGPPQYGHHRKATEYSDADRLMRTVKEGKVTPPDYSDYHEAYQHLGRFLDGARQHKRIHSALDYLPLAECELEWRRQSAHAPSVQ
jgi:hypothetical protein